MIIHKDGIAYYQKVLNDIAASSSSLKNESTKLKEEHTANPRLFDSKDRFRRFFNANDASYAIENAKFSISNYSNILKELTSHCANSIEHVHTADGAHNTVIQALKSTHGKDVMEMNLKLLSSLISLSDAVKNASHDTEGHKNMLVAYHNTNTKDAFFDRSISLSEKILEHSRKISQALDEFNQRSKHMGILLSSSKSGRSILSIPSASHWEGNIKSWL